MKDGTLESEVGYSANSDKEEAPSHDDTAGQGRESSNDSVVDNDQVKEAGIKVEEEEKEKEGNKEEENEKENREPCVNGDRLNNEAVTDIEAHGTEDHIGINNNEDDEDKDKEDAIQMNPPDWDKDYEIRINLLRQEINETEKKHELWQNGISSRKEEALKRWEMIKKKHQDRLKAHRSFHAVMDSVLKDNEETMKEEEYRNI